MLPVRFIDPTNPRPCPSSWRTTVIRSNCIPALPSVPRYQLKDELKFAAMSSSFGARSVPLSLLARATGNQVLEYGAPGKLRKKYVDAADPRTAEPRGLQLAVTRIGTLDWICEAQIATAAYVSKMRPV